jgi:hypothetical protein
MPDTNRYQFALGRNFILSAELKSGSFPAERDARASECVSFYVLGAHKMYLGCTKVCACLLKCKKLTASFAESLAGKEVI